MSVFPLQRIDSNGTVTSLNDHFNLQLIPKQQLDQTVNNDLTGNTLASESQRGFIHRIPSSNANGVNFMEDIFGLHQTGQGSRRLSISEYDVDNAGYYEYEYFGKKNEETARASFDNDDDEDVVMMSDDELRPFEFEFDLAKIAVAQPELEVFMADQFTDPLIDGTDEPQRKKMKDYFKLNIFGGNAGAPEDKKKYFWSRKKKNGLKNEEDEEIVVEETVPSVVINPSKLISNHQEIVVQNLRGFEDDDAVKEEPISQFTVFDTHVHDQAVESLAPTAVKRRSVGMPKPRGRKPSPIPDASKQFGCEFCDRRFKRQEHLKRHVRSLHMGEKPFNCLICGKKFSRSDNLNQHVKTHSHQ